MKRPGIKGKCYTTNYWKSWNVISHILIPNPFYCKNNNNKKAMLSNRLFHDTICYFSTIKLLTMRLFSTAHRSTQLILSEFPWGG